jgi:Ca-activated chloride channel family protein
MRFIIPFCLILTLLATAGCKSTKMAGASMPLELAVQDQPAAVMPAPPASYGEALPGPAYSAPGTVYGAQPEGRDARGEGYNAIQELGFSLAAHEPLSTFSIDVDTASYSNIRKFIESGALPPADAVRIEEMINYFTYAYPQPEGSDPFSVNTAVAVCPWQPKHRLLRVGLQGKSVEMEERPDANLVFLADVSGSMNEPDKLPLLKQGLTLLVRQLSPRDRLAIVTYAGYTGVALEPTHCTPENRQRIEDLIDSLGAGGSTHGSAGIQLAYELAEDQFREGDINRVILCTDGDFNVGVTTQEELIALIEDKAKSGVFLTVLGFGTGNVKDNIMETLADKGNGNYGYVDTLMEARRLLVQQVSGTLMTIAKDVKIQVEFNPAEIQAYRLIGYENRMLAKEDFNDDTKDAGEIGAGHSVTALYELVPAGVESDVMPAVDPLKYQQPPQPLSDAAWSGEWATVKLRYKAPEEDESKLIQTAVKCGDAALESADPEFQFASAVAAWGMILRDSPFKGEATPDLVRTLARNGKGADPEGYRGEFLRLVEAAEAL